MDLVRSRASITPHRIAFRFLTDATGDGEPITYAELDDRARNVAVALRDAGAAGGRVLNVCGLGKTVSEAQKRAYEAVDRIDWPEGFCRRDIGRRAIEREII